MPSPSRYYSSIAAKTTLSNSISASSTSLELAAASNLPILYPFTLILEKDTANEEVVEVTGLVGTSYQITRNIDSSGAKSHAVGALVEHGVSARDFTESRAHEVASSAHNVTGNIVGTGGAQTLTDKTLTSPIISGTPVITGLSSAGMVDSSAAPKNYVDSILGSAVAMATSAASAAVSASSAATSATSALTSQTAAATSAASALASQTAAATSAASALTSQTAAATSATSALASQTAAATSATSAAASATAAATSASSAATSATSAANSATTAAASVAAIATHAANALASQTAAATSATSAAASATAAATSATSASGSATTAANSAATATTSASQAATSASSAATSASSADTSATSAAASASAAATTYDNFDDRYLGAKASAPSLDNDGNALLTGALYFNSSLAAMYVWTGSAWSVMATSGDIESVTAGIGLTGGGASGAVTVSLDTSSVYAIPSQASANGKYLTSNGSTASWGTIQAGSQVKIEGGTAVTYDYVDFVGMGTDTGTAGTIKVQPLTPTGASTGKRIFTGTTTPSSPVSGDVWVDATASAGADLTTMTIMGAY